MDPKKLYEYLDLYFQGWVESLNLSESSKHHLVSEIVAGVRVLHEKPSISYDAWWDELHELFEAEYM